MRKKKFYEKAVLSERTQFLYRFKTVICDTRNPRNYATTHVAFRTESIPTTTFLARCLELNITHICRSIMLTLTCCSMPTSRQYRTGAPTACEKPTEHTIFQRENAGCIPPRIDNA